MINLEAVVDTVRGIYRDPKLSKQQKKLQAAPLLKAAYSYRDGLVQDVENTKSDISKSERMIACIDDMRDAWHVNLEDESDFRKSWCSQLRLEKNDCSRLHKLAEAISTKNLIEIEGMDELHPMPKDVRSFVIAHDWLAIVGDIEGEFNLPYPQCAFEFRERGRTVIALIAQEEGCEPVGSAFYESGVGDWMPMGNLTETTWHNQIKAACIVLDAEVAVHEVQRAPHQLNVKRAKAGKIPLYDFHVIDLAKRHRVSHVQSAGSGHRKRLHFCRGHWRHYEKSKTWIRWCLKGDPDLGYVDKEYRL